jgi:ferrous iron transport protein B
MGLTKNSMGNKLLVDDFNEIRKDIDFTIGLIGNPNVGKSSVFNNLTGLHQHTGNWPGKTIESSFGTYEYSNKKFLIVDLPGTYSLKAYSKEEDVTTSFIEKSQFDVMVVVVDATALERNLNLALQVLQITKNVVVCVNLLDEAKKKNIKINLKLLSDKLGVPVVGTIATKKKTLEELKEKIIHVATNKNNELVEYGSDEKIVKTAEIIASEVIDKSEINNDRDRKIDKILTSKCFGIPIMLVMLGFIFWLTIIGANYPSKFLSWMFGLGQEKLESLFIMWRFPQIVSSLLINGVYQTVTWIISVMLPPMAIFFPLFTLLEDLGVLPRIAFNLDNFFKKAGTCGKQALTMCMGFGCNAAGVIGCRIMRSTRERLIAIVTNCFVPCNGRFPLLITIATIFFVGQFNGIVGSLVSTCVVLTVILLGIVLSLFISKILSVTLLKGESSGFILELPPYRKPQIGSILVRSVLDRTLFVLGRAISSAIPAGIVIWIMANIQIDGTSMISYIAYFFDPIAKIMGLDGYILTAFIFGIPANEIVLPILLMMYMKSGCLIDISDSFRIGEILIENGWTMLTAINVMIFTILHFPCMTTLLTIKKETNSSKWVWISFFIPTACGIIVCILTNALFNIGKVLLV